MAELTAAQTVQAADHVIHDVGSTWMLHSETVARGVAHGYDKPLPFYFAGRGGVLGDVDADVVVAAMGWWHPGMVRKMWDRGVAVAGAREAARRYFAACAAWGEDHLADFAPAARAAELTGRVVAAAEGAGLPLFAGWRAEPLAQSAPARLLQLLHVMREWRGSVHLVATTAAGLGPLEAILTNEGEQQARFFGWRDDLPDCTHLKDRHVVAEENTDRLVAGVYERALDPAERAELVELVSQVEAAVR
ncbi:SCO6745 family protein [Actinophytocola sediminis]